MKEYKNFKEALEDSETWEPCVVRIFKHIPRLRRTELLVGFNCLVNLTSTLRMTFLEDLDKIIVESGWKFHELVGDVIWKKEIDEYYHTDLAKLRMAMLDLKERNSLGLIAVLDMFGDIKYE